MDRLAAMRTFVEIVDRGSLTAAADALDRSQPAVVRSLAALEAHLGVVLLQRTTRRMALTPEGREYLERARRILADVEEAEQMVGAAEAAPRGHLRMTAPVQFGQLHLAPLLAAFLDRWPAVSVDLQLLDRVVNMVEEGIDLSLRIGPLSDSTMIAVRVGEVRRVLCASPAFLARHGEPEDADALAALPAIRLDNLARTHWALREDGRDRSVAVAGRFGCNSIGAGVAACLAGVGVGQFLSYQVHEHLAAGRLVRLLEAWEPEPWPVSLVYPTGRLMTARQRALVDFLKDALRRVEAVDP
jgi:DNA-binding transcriptional LysR family regulator